MQIGWMGAGALAAGRELVEAEKETGGSVSSVFASVFQPALAGPVVGEPEVALQFAGAILLTPETYKEAPRIWAYSDPEGGTDRSAVDGVGAGESPATKAPPFFIGDAEAERSQTPNPVRTAGSRGSGDSIPVPGISYFESSKMRSAALPGAQAQAAVTFRPNAIAEEFPIDDSGIPGPEALLRGRSNVDLDAMPGGRHLDRIGKSIAPDGDEVSDWAGSRPKRPDLAHTHPGGVARLAAASETALHFFNAALEPGRILAEPPVGPAETKGPLDIFPRPPVPGTAEPTRPLGATGTTVMPVETEIREREGSIGGEADNDLAASRVGTPRGKPTGTAVTVTLSANPAPRGAASPSADGRRPDATEAYTARRFDPGAAPPPPSATAQTFPFAQPRPADPTVHPVPKGRTVEWSDPATPSLNRQSGTAGAALPPAAPVAAGRGLMFAEEGRAATDIGSGETPEALEALTAPGTSQAEAPRRADADLPETRPVRSVVAQVAEAIRQSFDGSVEIRMSPEELGRVRLSLVQSDAGLTVQLMAERAETLELLRRNVDSLVADLRDAGYAGLAFSFGRDGETHPNPLTETRDQLEPSTERSSDQPLQPRPGRAELIPDGALDIRI